ncbi:Protein pelota-like protein [Aphelenchoides besseyi]|nr:Protein pelota-like protein [Aphelenchoides besseyi]
MKILRRHIDRNGLGFVTLICDEEEDVWHVYNLIRPGDNVRCSTLRKVTTETQTGSKNSQRVHVTLTILVETITYDPSVCTLHLKGWQESFSCAYCSFYQVKTYKKTNMFEWGAYHTLDIEINRQFTLTKEVWDSMDLERLQNSADITHVADVAAVVMHEGLANVCLLTSTMTVVKSKIDVQIARKRKGFSSQHDKSLSRFFEMIVHAFMKHVVMENLKCVIIAMNAKDILQNRSKFLLVHSTSGFKHALKEVLADPAVANRISDTKAQAEVKALDTFMDLMNNDSARAVYGYNHVYLALNQLAIETLMISDLLFRSRNIQQRKKYVHLVEQAREQRVTVMIFSSMHVSGEQLGQLTGVAAILRYPIEGIDDDFEDDQANLQLPDEQWGDRDRVES